MTTKNLRLGGWGWTSESGARVTNALDLCPAARQGHRRRAAGIYDATDKS